MLLYATPAITAYILTMTTVLGLVMGSFLNCWAWRITHGGSVLHGRSHCTSCNHVLKVRDLVPVFSWLASKGRCRYCGAMVSVRYPLTELLCAVVFVSIVIRYDASFEALEMLCFASILLVLSLTDLDDYLIPNGCIIAAIVVRVLYIVVSGPILGLDTVALLVQSAIGAVAVFVPLLVVVLIADKLLKRDSMGGGDLKLFFVTGLYFGWQQCLFLIIMACIIGIVLALVSRPHVSSAEVADRICASDEDDATYADEFPSNSHPIPFGPSIALACWITMLFGTQLITWYTTLV